MQHITRVQFWGLFAVACYLHGATASTSSQTGHTVIFAEIIEYENPTGRSYNGSDVTPHRRCCDFSDKFPNDTTCTINTCDTVFSLCFGSSNGSQCDGIFLDLQPHMGRPRSNKFDQTEQVSFPMTRIETWPAQPQKLTVRVQDKDSHISGTSDYEYDLIDEVATTLNVSVQTSYWGGEFHTITLCSPYTKTTLRLKVFCESDYFGTGCNFTGSAGDYRHGTLLNNGQLAAVADCQGDGWSMIFLLGVTDPYNLSPSVLKTYLVKFVGDTICEVGARNVTIRLGDIRHDSTKNELRVVFYAECDQQPIKDTKVAVILTFMASQELQQYFGGHGLRRTDLSGQRDAARHTIIFRPVLFSNPSNHYYQVKSGNYQRKECPQQGCLPSFHVSYTKANPIYKAFLTSTVSGTSFKDCFGVFTTTQVPSTALARDTVYLPKMKAEWNSTGIWQIAVLHQNNTGLPIAYLDINVANVTMGQNYRQARVTRLSTTVPATGASISLDVIVWCGAGFKGDRCEIECNHTDTHCNQDVIASTGCGSHGRYDVGRCVCDQGYVGERCTINIDECQLGDAEFRCRHGVCDDGNNTYTCMCHNGYTGQTCETFIDRTNTSNCDVDIDDCTPNPCLHGTCIDDVNGYSCDCAVGYTGTNCDVDIDDCTPNPCLHGTCIDDVNGYSCDCAVGYTGTNCDIDIDDCTPNPCHHGACNGDVNSYSCHCAVGYTGTNCDVDIDDCTPNPCHHGTCNDGVNGYSCLCAVGYTGTNCDVDIDDCTPNPCLHGACKDHVNQYSCICETGYTGQLCELHVDSCVSSPCVYGTCYGNSGGYICECTPGFIGSLCDVDVDECSAATTPCPAFHLCNNTIGSFTCQHFEYSVLPVDSNITKDDLAEMQLAYSSVLSHAKELDCDEVTVDADTSQNNVTIGALCDGEPIPRSVMERLLATYPPEQILDIFRKNNHGITVSEDSMSARDWIEENYIAFAGMVVGLLLALTGVVIAAVIVHRTNIEVRAMRKQEAAAAEYTSISNINNGGRGSKGDNHYYNGGRGSKGDNHNYNKINRAPSGVSRQFSRSSSWYSNESDARGASWFSRDSIRPDYEYNNPVYDSIRPDYDTFETE